MWAIGIEHEDGRIEVMTTTDGTNRLILFRTYEAAVLYIDTLPGRNGTRAIMIRNDPDLSDEGRRAGRRACLVPRVLTPERGPTMPRLNERFSPSPEEMAGRIRAERERLGLSMAQAAEKLGVAKGTYQQLERRADPRLSTLLALAEALGMDPRRLTPELVRRK
jgi:DNA-binding XRE family transcriptional regulator